MILMFDDIGRADTPNSIAGTDEIGGPESNQTKSNIFTGRPLSGRILAEKKEGWSPLVIPIVNYKTERSAGFGLTGGATYNGHRGDPYFDYAEAFLQIAVVLASASIVLKNGSLLWGSGFLSLLGILLMLNGFTLAVTIPFIE